jgi:hypothetical protein
MINTKKVLLTILLVLIPFTAIVSSVYLSLKSKEEVKGVSTVTQECKPYITNVIPNVAYVGEEYYFVPNIVGCEKEDFNIYVYGVRWVNLVDEAYIYGIPKDFDIGVHRLEVVVQGDENSYSLVDYIIVKENEE